MKEHTNEIRVSTEKNDANINCTLHLYIIAFIHDLKMLSFTNHPSFLPNILLYLQLVGKCDVFGCINHSV